MEKIEKAGIKKQVNQTARNTLIYYVILAGLTVALLIGQGAMAAAGAAGTPAGQMAEELGQNIQRYAGGLSIAGTAAGLLFLRFRYRRKGCLAEMWQTRKKMEAGRFLQIFCVFMSCQAVFMAAAALAETVLNPLGYTLTEAAQNASAVSTTASMFLYTALIGPVAEELVFRGFVMKSLLPYGKGFAVVVSAVLFGAIHGNFLQGLFAAGSGLVFGYVAVEYSLKWSILIHILNNMVFSDLLGRLTKLLPETAQAAVEYGITLGFFLAACVILFQNKSKIRRWWRDSRPGKRCFLYAFTSIWVILFCAMQFLVALDGVGRITSAAG